MRIYIDETDVSAAKTETEATSEKKKKAKNRWNLVKGAIAVGVVGTGKVALGPGGMIFGMLTAMLFYKKKLGKVGKLLMKLLKNQTLWRTLLFLYEIGLFNLDNLKKILAVFHCKKKFWALACKFAKVMMKCGSRVRDIKYNFDQDRKWYTALVDVVLSELADNGEDDRTHLLYEDEEEDFLVWDYEEHRKAVVKSCSDDSDFEDDAEFVLAEGIPDGAEVSGSITWVD